MYGICTQERLAARRLSPLVRWQFGWQYPAVSISEQNRAIYEGAGLSAVKLELAIGGIRFNLGLSNNQDQAREWVRQKERALLIRRIIQGTVVAIGTVAAVVAAVASVLELRR
jgi:hypothetical protein